MQGWSSEGPVPRLPRRPSPPRPLGRLPPPPRPSTAPPPLPSATRAPTAPHLERGRRSPAEAVPRLGAISLSDIRFLRRLGAGDIGSFYLAVVKPKEKPSAGAGAVVLVAAKVMDRKELEVRNKEGHVHGARDPRGRGPPLPAAALRRRRGGPLVLPPHRVLPRRRPPCAAPAPAAPTVLRGGASRRRIQPEWGGRRGQAGGAPAGGGAGRRGAASGGASQRARPAAAGGGARLSRSDRGKGEVVVFYLGI
ncbi:hypothetical protein PVAP13_4KG270210 [Panicum virgatum]|uniref:Protein kinase domain-containing protein n=1 Tax=Panicum virgatum TaxID=38727 RepID=A0A8T0TU04_PANVG|nr:hypothetical protein PVAP13_4KG270210 [Panicum virgatum]